VEIAERIRSQSASLTAAERRVAEAILESPQAVGFGTVADLAAAAQVGAASVVRLAAKLGFDGFSDLQDCVQHDLLQQLRPAAERIREATAAGRDSHLAVELGNVQATLDAASEQQLATLTLRLADLARPVVVVSGEATSGVAAQFVHQLHQLRPSVALLIGSDVLVRREVALLDPAATVIMIDLRRYEQWVLDVHVMVAERGIWSAALTDSVLSPIAAGTDATFLVTAGSAGPFDSHVGTLALLNLVAVRVAEELRSSAADRLATIEAAWRQYGSLSDGARPGSGAHPGR
jgi:DNA-binding MurR/RpiR family transcriptional regulator